MIKVKESDMEFERVGPCFNFSFNTDIYQSKATHLPTKLCATAFSTTSYEDSAKRAMSCIEEQLGVIAAFLFEQKILKNCMGTIPVNPKENK